jgi:hypothetical protein
MKTVKTIYTFNGVDYNENQIVTLNFKIALRNLDTVLKRWSRFIRSYIVGNICEVANNIQAKNVLITAYAFNMCQILEDLGYHETSPVYDNVSVCQHKFAKNKSFYNEPKKIIGCFVCYTPGLGYKLVDNTPAVVKGNQLMWFGKLYRRNLPFVDSNFSLK